MIVPLQSNRWNDTDSLQENKFLTKNFCMTNPNESIILNLKNNVIVDSNVRIGM